MKLDILEFLPIAPPVIVLSAGLLSRLVSRGKWMVHIAAFVATILVVPLFIRIQALIDPTTIQYPGPGDGFILILYALLWFPSAIGYAIFCYLSRR